MPADPDFYLEKALQCLGKLPGKPDGTNLSSRGAKQCIQEAAKSYLAEHQAWKASPPPSAITENLEEISKVALKLAQALERLSGPEKQRISKALPEDWLFAGKDIKGLSSTSWLEMPAEKIRNMREADLEAFLGGVN